MPNETSPLSERERDVARILLQGKGNKQIALELGISSRTVEFHLKNMYAKLGVASRAEALLKLTETDLWKTTGDLPVESTVDKKGDPTDNDIHVISWRIPMKKFYFGVAAGVLITALIAASVIFNLPGRDVELTPAPVVATLTVSTATNIPTGTSPVPTVTVEPEAEQVVIPPHTVDGYTAAIESYYIDFARIIFQMRLTGGDLESGQPIDGMRLGNWDLYDEYGNLVNSSSGLGPTVDADPQVLEISFEPLVHLKGDRFKGQFAFNLHSPAPDYGTIMARFRFDIDLPFYEEVRFFPKQTVSANGLEMLLDSVTVTPVFTQVYLCFQPPSNDPWTFGNGTVLQIAGHEALLYNASGLFSSATGSYWGTRSEPYWVPPIKNGSCSKIRFQTGTSNPTSLTLTIPDLENLIVYFQQESNPLFELNTLYPGLGRREAYHTYLEEHGYTYKGPWVFNVELVP